MTLLWCYPARWLPWASIDPLLILVLLIVCAALGSWMAYLQGRWLNRLPIVQRWIDSVPSEKLQMVDKLLGRHGLVALFCARFVPVVRSLLPLMMGMRVKEAPKFHYFSWLSATLWTLLLVGLGYLLPSLPEPISKTVTMGLMAAPVMTFCIRRDQLDCPETALQIPLTGGFGLRL